jgi:hypothetical protein
MLRAPLAALVIIVGAIALVGSASADPRFDPSFSVGLTQPAPQVPSEVTLSFRLDTGYQLSTAVIHIPFDWGVAPGDQVPVGTRVASIDSIETFGLINSACNQALAIHFELLNATLDASRTVSFGDTDKVHFDPDGYGTYESGYGTVDFAEDKDANGIVDAVDHYPDFFDATLGDLKPIARIAGVGEIAGVYHLRQFLIFAPGSRLSLPDPLLSQAIAVGAQSGYPMLMVTQDFRNPDAPP